MELLFADFVKFLLALKKNEPQERSLDPVSTDLLLNFFKCFLPLDLTGFRLLVFLPT